MIVAARTNLRRNAMKRTQTRKALPRDLDAKEEVARVITMFVPDEAAGMTSGLLTRTKGESDQRYAERSVLMDKLFAMPDAG